MWVRPYQGTFQTFDSFPQSAQHWSVGIVPGSQYLRTAQSPRNTFLALATNEHHMASAQKNQHNLPVKGLRKGTSTQWHVGNNATHTGAY